MDKKEIVVKGKKIAAHLIGVAPLLMTRVLADTFDPCSLWDSAQKIAFWGAVAGVMFYGALKIYSILFPEQAGQARNYLKEMALGLAFFGLAFQIVGFVAEKFGIAVIDGC